jgi:hypothetical protein
LGYKPNPLSTNSFAIFGSQFCYVSQKGNRYDVFEMGGIRSRSKEKGSKGKSKVNEK